MYDNRTDVKVYNCDVGYITHDDIDVIRYCVLVYIYNVLILQYNVLKSNVITLREVKPKIKIKGEK